ncbi:uncharacterized protein LOC143221763 [Lasioglossum baleicum]|uniref:uncharacterized protein LOC143221763 n=1 Tax=Lasioglossum baleicum TaxID=434251 RepID=UPI003FCCF881
MSVIVNRILNCRRGNVRKLFDLRLYKQSSHVPCSNNEWNKRNFITLQRFPEEHERFLVYRTSTNIAYNQDEPPRNVVGKLSEHRQMHKYLQESSNYTETIVPPIKSTFIVSADEVETIVNMNWTQESSLTCLNAMKKLAHYHLNGSCLLDEMYENILNNLTTKLSAFSDKEIHMLMPYLIVMNSKWLEMKPYASFTKELSKQCMQRFFSADIKELLFTIDAFYQLQLYSAQYMWRSLRKVASKMFKLSGKEMIQVLFYMSMCKAPNLQMFELECQLLEKLSEVSADELGIACRGFFMSRRKIQNSQLVEQIMEKVTNNVFTMQDLTLAAVMKQMRYSANLNIQDELNKFLVQFRSDMENRSLLLLMHVAQTMASLRVYDPVVMKHISDRLEKEFSTARLKDIERILYAICTISPSSEYRDACKRILDLLLSTYKTVRANEFMQHPKVIFHILTYLSYKKIYSEELLRFIFEPAYLINAHKNNMWYLTSDFLILACTVEIELPNYTGPLLNDELRTCLVKKFCARESVDEGYAYLRFRTELLYMCKEVFGPDVHFDYILPHYYISDVIIGFDEQNKCVPAQPILSEIPNGTIKRVPNIKWKILVPLSYHSRVMNHDEYSGPVRARLRQLQSIGYIPIPLYKVEWDKYESKEEKCSYLEKLVLEHEPVDYWKD